MYSRITNKWLYRKIYWYIQMSCEPEAMEFLHPREWLLVTPILFFALWDRQLSPSAIMPADHCTFSPHL